MSEGSGLNQGSGVNDGAGLGDYSLADELGLDPQSVADLDAVRYRGAVTDRIGGGIVRHTDGQARSYRINNDRDQTEQVRWLLDNEGLFPPSEGRR